jgi:hypothetical protein
MNPTSRTRIRAELCDRASVAACRARCGSESVTLSALAVAAVMGFDAGHRAATEAKDPRMELSAYALREDAALVLCRGRHGMRRRPRHLDERGFGCSLISVGRRVAL